jgi:hypothetical protein
VIVGAIVEVLSWSSDDSHAFGPDAAGVGDTNGDGFDDLALAIDLPQAPSAVVFGSATGPTGAPMPLIAADDVHHTGLHVHPAGDLDGDGFADVALTYAVDDPFGFFVAYGSSLGPTPAIPYTGRDLDQSAVIAPAGDVDGDGYDDVVVSKGTAYPNEVTLYRGSPDRVLDPSATWLMQSGGVGLGWALAGGDVDGDGFSDLLVQTDAYRSGLDEPGAVLVYRGSPGGPGDSPDYTLSPTAASGLFGGTIATGDVDGDTFTDVVVGDQGNGHGANAVVYFGGPDGPAPNTIVLPTRNANPLVVAVAVAGDLDQDGFDDVVVAEVGPINDDGTWTVAISVFDGSIVGPSPEPSSVVTWNVDHPVVTVAAAGSAFGDPRPGVLVGTSGSVRLFRAEAHQSDSDDADGDGYPALSARGAVIDCDDADRTVHPGAVDTGCDGVDADCDGDDGACDVDDTGTDAHTGDDDGHDRPDTDTDVVDRDGDGYGIGRDCDDAAADVHPGAVDVWNDGIDQDCSGTNARFVGCTHAPGGGYAALLVAMCVIRRRWRMNGPSSRGTPIRSS